LDFFRNLSKKMIDFYECACRPCHMSTSVFSKRKSKFEVERYALTFFKAGCEVTKATVAENFKKSGNNLASFTLRASVVGRAIGGRGFLGIEVDEIASGLDPVSSDLNFRETYLFLYEAVKEEQAVLADMMDGVTAATTTMARTGQTLAQQGRGRTLFSYIFKVMENTLPEGDSDKELAFSSGTLLLPKAVLLHAETTDKYNKQIIGGLLSLLKGSEGTGFVYPKTVLALGLLVRSRCLSRLTNQLYGILLASVSSKIGQNFIESLNVMSIADKNLKETIERMHGGDASLAFDGFLDALKDFTCPAPIKKATAEAAQRLQQHDINRLTTMLFGQEQSLDVTFQSAGGGLQCFAWMCSALSAIDDEIDLLKVIAPMAFEIGAAALEQLRDVWNMSQDQKAREVTVQLLGDQKFNLPSNPEERFAKTMEICAEILDPEKPCPVLDSEWSSDLVKLSKCQPVLAELCQWCSAHSKSVNSGLSVGASAHDSGGGYGDEGSGGFDLDGLPNAEEPLDDDDI
jgi:hypothetical protein